MLQHFKTRSEFYTDRLAIRPIGLDDCEFVFQLLNTEGWIKNIGQRNITDLTAAQNYIQRLTDSPNVAYQVIRLRETGMPIGFVTFIQRDYLNCPDIGFALLPAYFNMGYAYEASKAFLEIIAQTGNYSKVVGICIESNKPSIRLLEKLGLRFQHKFVNDGEELCLYAVELHPHQT
jgi:[ribosomal protein S5]-alanine N-acetyltransferase